MANHNTSNPEFDNATLARLAAQATDREPSKPPAPVPTDGWYWRTVDKIGPYTAYMGLACVVVAFLAALIGGTSWSWVSFLSIPTIIFFVLYAKYLIRRYQQEQAAQYLTSRQRQEVARLEVARLVVAQSQREAERVKSEE